MLLKIAVLKKYLPLIFLLMIVFTSCRTQRAVVYNPSEVKQLSGELGFSINNTDENIPLYAEASRWLGTPYRYAGLSRRGIDCSGLANRIYLNVYKKNIPRSTSDLEKATHKVSKGKLKTGDFVFFATGKNKKKISHVGIYLKDGCFVHASTSKGVIISHLNENYYTRTWRRGGRLK